MQLGHYTSTVGLKGILQSETLWATNIKYLNDQQEFDHALRLVKRVLPTGRRTKKNTDFAAFQSFVDQVDKAIAELGELQHKTVFTCSFSAETDLLSQWRGYCAAGSGYAVVFDVSALLIEVTAAFPNSRLVTCVYGDEKKERIVRAKLNEYYEAFSKTSSSDRATLLLDLAEELTILAASFKDSTFSEEKESRFVIVEADVTTKAMSFRVGPGGLIPYLSIPSRRAHVKQIIVGPTIDRARALAAAQLFLSHNFDTAVMPSVVASKTPYRSW